MSDPTFSAQVLRHGAYLCFASAAAASNHDAITQLMARFGFVNEFDAVKRDQPPATIAFLRRVRSVAMEIEDNSLHSAEAILHVSAVEPAVIDAACEALVSSRILRGVVRPRFYTSPAIHEFAYEHQVEQQTGTAMPNVFIVPMSKSGDWWAKDWMERHTYFLPRYSDAGRQVSQGHVLTAATGVPCLYRRTYKYGSLPAPQGEYDFVNYFECADRDVNTFRAVCAALRDPAKNPEWKFVREGPTWEGRRVESWASVSL
jgi:hypothetical protein